MSILVAYNVPPLPNWNILTPPQLAKAQPQLSIKSLPSKVIWKGDLASKHSAGYRGLPTLLPRASSVLLLEQEDGWGISS